MTSFSPSLCWDRFRLLIRYSASVFAISQLRQSPAVVCCPIYRSQLRYHLPSKFQGITQRQPARCMNLLADKENDKGKDRGKRSQCLLLSKTHPLSKEKQYFPLSKHSQHSCNENSLFPSVPCSAPTLRNKNSLRTIYKILPTSLHPLLILKCSLGDFPMIFLILFFFFQRTHKTTASPINVKEIKLKTLEKCSDELCVCLTPTKISLRHLISAFIKAHKAEFKSLLASKRWALINLQFHIFWFSINL